MRRQMKFTTRRGRRRQLPASRAPPRRQRSWHVCGHHQQQGRVEYGRPSVHGSHKGHHLGDTGVHCRCLARFFSFEDLCRPHMGFTEAEAPPSPPAEASAGGSTPMSGREASRPDAYTSGAPGSPVIGLPDMRNTNRSAGNHLGQVLYTCAVQN